MSQTILSYSESGLGKTSNVGQFARYQFHRTGKPIRLVTCDSGFGPCQPEVEEGMIIPICLETCVHPVPVLNKLSKGEWPVKAIEPKQGLWGTDIGSSFIKLKPGEAGGYAVEGLTRICELVRKAWTDEQRNIGEPLQGQFEQMGEKFAFQSRGTLFGIQQLINNVVINFRGLPVDRVLWTGHESKGKDLMGSQVLGPATTGQALTDKISGWFEIVLHHDSYQYEEPSRRDPSRMLKKTAMRAWFQRHPDADYPKMYWPAKLGLSPQLTAAMYSYFEEGYFPLILDMVTGEYVQGIHTFLSIIDNGGRLPEAQVEQPIPFEPTEEPEWIAASVVAEDEIRKTLDADANANAKKEPGAGFALVNEANEAKVTGKGKRGK